jgi:hypothetical protein
VREEKERIFFWHRFGLVLTADRLLPLLTGSGGYLIV